MLALALVMVILFLAIAIDLGFAYVTRANLSKAVDAAALAGMSNLNLGTAMATTIAETTFAANYHAPGSSGPPPPDVYIGPDTDPTSSTYGKTVARVTASTTRDTFFARVLPTLSTLTVASSGTAVKAKLVMSLALDRSGSMKNNGGANALPPAVDSFIMNFDNTNDHVAMVSFASDDSTNDPSTPNVTMTTGFQDPIKSAVSGWYSKSSGATFAYGGLKDAKDQNATIAVAPGDNVAKVVVFFTDGIANTIQDNLSCPGFPLINYGGNAPSEGNGVWFMNPRSGATQCQITSGGRPSCCTATGFPSQKYGTVKPFTTTNITGDAEYRMLQMANDMRNGVGDPVPTAIYAIGLGTDVNMSFLQELANDSHSDTFNSSQPTGLALQVASCTGASSTTCTTDLTNAFNMIAKAILLRLSK
jgi:hypothetical protein